MCIFTKKRPVSQGKIKKSPLEEAKLEPYLHKYPNFEADLQHYMVTLSPFEIYYDKLDVKRLLMQSLHLSNCDFLMVQSSKQNRRFSTIAPTGNISHL